MRQKRHIRLTEGDLRRIMRESVDRVLRESENDLVSVGFKTWDNDEFQEVQAFLEQKGYRIETEKTYTHGPIAGTPEYEHNTLSGGDIYIKERFSKEDAIALSQELFNNFGKFVRINGFLCQNIREVELQVNIFSRYI